MGYVDTKLNLYEWEKVRGQNQQDHSGLETTHAIYRHVHSYDNSNNGKKKQHRLLVR